MTTMPTSCAGSSARRPIGGDYILRGLLDAECGALLKTAIDTLGHGLAPGETRMALTRRADALVELAATQLRCGEHRDVHGQRPHLTLTVSAETLRADGPAGADARPAELSGVGPIHPATARRIACDAVRTVVTVAAPAADASPWTAITTPVLPLSATPARRTIPAHLRSALCLRDKGCRFPGCDRPPAWTDGHHVVHWSHGGTTDLENLVYRYYNRIGSCRVRSASRARALFPPDPKGQLAQTRRSRNQRLKVPLAVCFERGLVCPGSSVLIDDLPVRVDRDSVRRGTRVPMRTWRAGPRRRGCSGWRPTGR
jgi:hypothetical protein